jgi:hypothetical protein
MFSFSYKHPSFKYLLHLFLSTAQLALMCRFAVPPTCPPNQVFSTLTCSCVNCLPIACQPNFQQDPVTCNCKCAPTDAMFACGRGRALSPVTCDCQPACDWIQQCKVGYRWDRFANPCKCVSCAIPETCFYGKYWSVSQCACV